MTTENWDPDQSRLLTSTDADDDSDAIPARYGVTAWESSRPEPLAVALAQEQPETDRVPIDDMWADFDADSPFAGRLIEGDDHCDEYASAVDEPDAYSAEELAIHVIPT